MRLLEDLLLLATNDSDHPALRHLAYESYDTPHRIVRRIILQTLNEHGVDAAIDRYFELLEEHPAEAFTPALLQHIAETLLARGDSAGALEVFRVNVELYEDSADARRSLADALSGQTD